MARMYHPKTGAEIDWVPDVEETIGVFKASGWELAPEPEGLPGHEPEPTVYAPVTSHVSGDYENFTVAQLSDELKDRGLPVSGTKDELIARLVEDDEQD